MSFIPGEKLHYAETHFKFKLPWSLLYKPWPEILVDAPFQFVPGVEPTVWIVVRDAHRFPTLIEKAEINGKTFELQIQAKEQFGFYPVKLGNLEPGVHELDCKIYAKRISENGERTETKVFTRWNYPGLKPKPLKIQVLAEEPPKAPGFVAGEMHCHTHYSADHVEHGASPAVLQQAAKAVGLDFVSCTDHAYDFAYTTEDYTKEADTPLTRFDALREEVRKLNQNAGMPLMIAGEEVSAGNSKGENVHMTVLGPECYLPGLGDCGRNWLDNKPTFKIPKLLEMTAGHCFAAHPMQPMGYLEKFIFRRGYWSHKDLNQDATHMIRGIQFWNGIRDEGFKLGREWWIEELGKGNFLLPIGGNDAHGDLNDTTSVNMPLISLGNSREHVFGKVRTVVKVNQSVILSEVEGSKKNLSLESLNEAFAGDNCYITDGPALWWERSKKTVTFHARNTQDFGGAFRYIRIFGRKRSAGGKLAKNETVCIESLVLPPASTDITVNKDDFAYLRAECETATGKFAMTSAAVL
ncbi:PHP domain-containing protein [Fibrobacter sp.]|uniref:PHP domain-containing protein n=1 Tax=Fibrobacter sp. TaxID=35828 RepID=UPI003890DA25